MRWGKRRYKIYTEERRDLPRLMFQISMNVNVEKYSERERGELGEL